jgi:hypothetical protein
VPDTGAGTPGDLVVLSFQETKPQHRLGTAIEQISEHHGIVIYTTEAEGPYSSFRYRLIFFDWLSEVLPRPKRLFSRLHLTR